MQQSSIVLQSFKSAAPIIAGYLVLGIPCGLLCAEVGMNAVQVLIMSVLFYSGAGQYMIPNMWLSGAPILSIIASVSLVNTRQVLYGAALSEFCEKTSKRLTFLFAATVTDESFGVNTARFKVGDWDVKRATLVNLFSQISWTLANLAGVLMGSLLTVPVSLASFAMTAIFICLLFSLERSRPTIIAAASAFAGVIICKYIGLAGPAIFIGAIVGIAVALLYSRVKQS